MADDSDAAQALASAQTNGINGNDDLNHVKHESDGDADDGLDGIDWGAQADQDDDDIKNLFAGDGMRMPEGFEQFGDKDIDQTGKADDAEDFEDIDLSDEDLDDDDNDAAAPKGDTDLSHAPGLTEDEGTSHEERLDDLFGDDDGDHDPFPSSPQREAAPAIVDNDALNKPDTLPDSEAQRQQEEAAALAFPEKTAQEKELTDEEFNRLSWMERIKLNFPQYSADDNAIGDWITQTNNEDPSMQAPPQTEEELLQHKFPDFSQGKILYMNELFPQWPAEYMYKEPPNKDRDPPEFVPTKLELELDADTSKLFRISDSTLAANQQRAQNQNDVEDWGHPLRAPALDFDDGMSDDSDGDQLVGGFTLDEIATLCDDWEGPLHSLGLSKDSADKVAVAAEDEPMSEWDREILGATEPKVKKPKYKSGLPDITAYDASGIDDFFDTAKAGAKRVRIPRNDPYLLIEDVQLDRPTKRQKTDDKMVRMANGQLRRDVRLHFNISNDAAYDQLKINHKSKVRAVLSNRAVEHSMPALKLTFPFYRTGAPAKFWEHHRKKLEIEKVVKHAIGVRKPMRIKKKDWKNKSVAELFKTSKDLSLNDNSTAILFEYSEQHPIMLSNFGMGNRIINYYRAKDSQDTERPKAEIGEGHILMPEDRSPFSIFGTVDPGQTIPTLHNEMYRAPIFKHEPRPNDFLVGYSTNVAEGPKWYVRNIDHIYVVGQTFPSMEVPGPHARKVTNTSKNRLKMVCYRMMRKRETLDVSIGEVTPHVFDKVDPQNRQKLKEFLTYDRDRKTWSLREGETMMDGAGIRAMIKPEDVCVIESMQVGKKQLEGAGYDLKKDDDEDEGEKPLVAKLAPWEITKNFIEASAGKAMVALHGEGDPTGHGLGFSFIKTSMKGGYINAVQGPLATSADAIERERKANGGHSYNVKKQQDMYNAAIRQIWERQSATLSDTTTHADTDVLDTANEDDRLFSQQQKQPPATPAAMLDDGRSQLSRLSAGSRLSKRKLRIVRRKRNEAGELETESIIIEDAVVIRNYMKQRREKEEADRDVYSLLPTGDADDNREKQRLVEKELSRLLKNQDRRQMRELQGKGKGKKKKASTAADANGDASADPASVEKAAAGTTRKCANCGQVGHIKTNKSKCPLLNGTATPKDNAADHGGFGSFTR